MAAQVEICPASCCTELMSAPAASIAPTNVRRRSCGENCWKWDPAARALPPVFTGSAHNLPSRRILRRPEQRCRLTPPALYGCTAPPPPKMAHARSCASGSDRHARVAIPPSRWMDAGEEKDQGLTAGERPAMVAGSLLPRGQDGAYTLLGVPGVNHMEWSGSAMAKLLPILCFSLFSVVAPLSLFAFGQDESGWCSEGSRHQRTEVNRTVIDTEVENLSESSVVFLCVEVDLPPERRGLLTWDRRRIVELGYLPSASEDYSGDQLGVLHIYTEHKPPVGIWEIDPDTVERFAYRAGQPSQDLGFILDSYFASATEDNVVVRVGALP